MDKPSALLLVIFSKYEQPIDMYYNNTYSNSSRATYISQHLRWPYKFWSLTVMWPNPSRRTTSMVLQVQGCFLHPFVLWLQFETWGLASIFQGFMANAQDEVWKRMGCETKSMYICDCYIRPCLLLSFAVGMHVLTGLVHKAARWSIMANTCPSGDKLTLDLLDPTQNSPEILCCLVER